MQPALLHNLSKHFFGQNRCFKWNEVVLHVFVSYTFVFCLFWNNNQSLIEQTKLIEDLNTGHVTFCILRPNIRTAYGKVING